MITRAQAKDIVEEILGAYATQAARLSPERIGAMGSAFYAGLCDLDFVAVELAKNRLIKSSRWIPSVAELRAAVVEQERGLQRPGGAAWGDVHAMRTFRERSALGECDPIVVQICQAFDWIEWRKLFRNGEEVEQWHVVTSAGEAALAADRARFIELYDKTAGAARKETAVAIGAGAILRELPSGDTPGISLGDVVQRLLPREERDEVMRCETHREGARE